MKDSDNSFTMVTTVPQKISINVKPEIRLE